MMAKPVSSACNLSCEYCYYSGKSEALNVGTTLMSREVLEAFTRQNIEMHGRDAVISFAWHGGEPLLAGLDFFREAVSLQQKYGRDRKILNTLQTNATLLNDEFCEFFRDNGFLLGVSVDGPREIHNRYRGDSFDDVMRGIELLRRYDVPFNTLTAVNDINSQSPREVYSFLREITDYMQFLPVAEISEDSPANFSVRPKQWGRFLVEVFRLWLKYDASRKHVQIFDAACENVRGIPCSLCSHNPLCGHSGSVEANGDLYSCDRYAFPSYYLGNIMDTDMKILMDMNRDFGMNKTYGLPDECFDCLYVKLCFGGCPGHRLKGGKNYLCEGYRIFFSNFLKQYKAPAENTEAFARTNFSR